MRSLLAAAVVVSCAGLETPSTERDIGASTDDLRERMHRRFVATVIVRDAIERGDIAAARAAARTIELLPEPEVTPDQRPLVEAVRVAAADLTRSTDPSSAARSLATLGERCADCHLASSARRERVMVGWSATPMRVTSQMNAHHWASGRLWDGLVSASERTWFAGAEVLERAPLTLGAEEEVFGDEPGIADDVARVRLLARRARSASTNHERAEIYGEVVSTCVECHRTIRDLAP